MNSIEHLWLPWKSHFLQPHTVQELQDQLMSAWYKIPQTIYENFVELKSGVGGFEGEK